MPRDAYSMMGGLAEMAGDYLDERGLQPPPTDAPWPQQALPSPGDPAPWRPEPTRLARWPYEPPPITGSNLEQQSSIDAADAAAYQTQSRYRNALARDPESNKMGALAELAAPQTPLDYALLASGPLRVASVPVRAAIYGGAAALDPTEAKVAPWKKLISATSVYDLSKPDPLSWHRIANRKLTRPLEDIPIEMTGERPTADIIRPEKMEGSVITPLVGDPTSAGMSITSIDKIPLTYPLNTWGGHGYIRETGGYANDASMATTYANRVKQLQEKFDTDQIIGTHMKMGAQSGDFSHHTWSALARMLPNAGMSKKEVAALDSAIEDRLSKVPQPKGEKRPEFPGVKSDGLEQHLASQPDPYRKAFITAVEQSEGKIGNVPDVVAVRKAITDPDLLYAPAGSSGLSMTRLTGGVERGTHPDFPRHLMGENPISLGAPLRQEVVFPDIVKNFDRTQDPPFWARKMYIPPSGIPHAQVATPRWVDDVSRYQENVGQMGELAAFNKYVLDRFGWK